MTSTSSVPLQPHPDPLTRALTSTAMPEGGIRFGVSPAGPETTSEAEKSRP